MEVRGLKSIPSNKIVYCTMEVDGCDKLQTDQAEASKPWYARSPSTDKWPAARLIKYLTIYHTIIVS